MSDFKKIQEKVNTPPLFLSTSFPKEILHNTHLLPKNSNIFEKQRREQRQITQPCKHIGNEQNEQQGPKNRSLQYAAVNRSIFRSNVVYLEIEKAPSQ